jgi:hypothetical protein
MKPNIDSLHEIQTVTAPEAMYEDIIQKIQRRKQGKMSAGLSFGLGAAAVLLLLLNSFLFMMNHESNQRGANITTALHLMDDNQLYK